ncbi:DUF6089 family protein [Tenacibaculum maritimum]|uniref:type IX secretion system protein PorG n=1 Tax=Tenacibaculum maritimum TaxID=107401 RepID=UPI0012E4E01F|nr:DUF6089 family protein [Tenacibaculum maritimum]CAA0148481.1 Protein of unknown function precursor, putative outer membrane protein [Tenacibaculum maritimum]
MKKNFFAILFTCLTSILFSQTHEIGFFLGGSNYIGDIGKTNFILPNKVAMGALYKYNLNPRVALRGTYSYLPISGNDLDADNLFRKQTRRRFKNTIHELAVGVEFNFFEYNISDHKKIFTPYILAEIAAFNYKSPDTFNSNNNTVSLKNNFSYTIPLGIGIKGRLTDNVAIAFESIARFTFIDDLDYSTSRIPQLNFKGNGNDWYVFTGISLVYSFGRPPCYNGYGLTE